MILTTYTNEDKIDIISQVPFHIERPEDTEIGVGENLSTFLFNDELLEENPLESIIDILLKKS